MNDQDDDNKNRNATKPALVFGASGEQGRAVIEGFVDAGYSPVYAFSRCAGTTTGGSFSGGLDGTGTNVEAFTTASATTATAASFNDQQYLTDALGCILLTGDIANPEHVRQALVSTKAEAIFLVTTTEFPEAYDIHDASPIRSAMDAEYDVIVQFFKVVKEVVDSDVAAASAAATKDGGSPKKIPKRTVIFSTRDNVEEIYRQEIRKEESGCSTGGGNAGANAGASTTTEWLQPLDDGSIVAHYTAKGKAGQEALKMVKGMEDHLNVILLTVPFFYSNFLAFFAPLPNDGRTQWELSACFGDGSTKIDMMSAGDLSTIVPHLVEEADKYNGQNLRVAAEKISMDEIAWAFSDLYGKDVVYNPLLPKELAAMNFPSAPAVAQMCQFLGDPRSPQHDCELTASLMKYNHHQPRATTFKDWLLTHSDSTAFSRVGLDLDGDEITEVTVFSATSEQGKSVINGLLADQRKRYKIRAATRRELDSPDILKIKALDPERVQLVNADFDDIPSCQKAVEGVDGVFLVADFYEPAHDSEELETEERHTKNIIDACENSNVKHLVISTLERAEDVNRSLPEKELLHFSPRARMAAYARTKKLRVSYMLLPCYPELFLDMIDEQVDDSGNKKLVLKVPLKDQHTKVAIFGLEELGTAVANVFDSYECYAGHEIGLVSDFVSVSDVKDVLEDVFSDTKIEIQPESPTKERIRPNGTYMKDLGQLFASLSHAPDVRSRHSVARTFKLVPSAKNLRRWVEQNQDNPVFREKLGLR